MKNEDREYYDILDKDVGLFHLIHEPVFIIAGDTYEMLFANRTACNLFALGHYYGKKCYTVLQNEQQLCDGCNHFTTMELGHADSWICYYPFLEKHFKVDMIIVRYQEQLCCLEVAIDITVQVEQEKILRKTLKKIKNISYIDDMTKVRNRNAFIRDMKQYTTDADRDQSVGVVFFDLNELKQINDRYGHNTGDIKIIVLARALRLFFRRNEIYRMGGDEFVVICRGIQKQHFVERIQKLEKKIQKNIKLSVSVGYAWSSECSALKQLVKEADKRMYKHKREYYAKKN